jgi:integrase
MGRRRQRDKYLPLRVYRKHGRYWYVDRENKWRDLGCTESGMYRELSKLAERPHALTTMNSVFDRYLLERLPLLAPRTQRDYRGYLRNLRLVFGTAPPKEIEAAHVFDYRNKRAERSVVQANREKACLSAVFTAALEWRVVRENPCRHVPRIAEPARVRYVTDAEFAAVYQFASPTLQCAMDLATMTGQREGDLLRLARDQLTTEGIAFRIGKSKRRHPRHGKIVETAKQLTVQWSPTLKAVIGRLQTLGPDIRPTLLCNRQGMPFTESGFRSNWHHLMQKAVASKVITEPFTFHDLRAKSASDAASPGDATELLAHDDPRTTRKVYLRKPRRVRAGAKILDTAGNIRQQAAEREANSLIDGGQGRNRTTDTRIFSPLLYQLSYLAAEDGAY